MRTTLKDIKNTSAIDLTKFHSNEVYSVYHEEHGFKTIAYSCGVYGLNGIVVQGYTTGKLYKVCSRCSALFIVY